MVEPRENKDPEARVHNVDRTPTLSVETGLPKLTATDCSPTEGEAARSEGQTMTGGTLSRTLTANEQDDWRNAPSTAVQVTVVSDATEKLEPEGGLHDVLRIPD